MTAPPPPAGDDPATDDVDDEPRTGIGTPAGLVAGVAAAGIMAAGI